MFREVPSLSRPTLHLLFKAPIVVPSGAHTQMGVVEALPLAAVAGVRHRAATHLCRTEQTHQYNLTSNKSFLFALPTEDAVVSDLAEDTQVASQIRTSTRTAAATATLCLADVVVPRRIEGVSPLLT